MNALEKLEKAKQDIQDKIDKLKNETTIKVGNWYKGSYNDNRNIIFYAREIDEDEDIIGYGFVENGWSYNAIFSNLDSETMKTIKPATNEEVEAALIKEAKRRGFLKGVKSKCLEDLQIETIKEEKYEYTEHTDGDKCLWVQASDYGNGFNLCVFNNGKWAEIIQEPKVVVNGYEMKQEGDIISFGCAKFDRRQLECFYSDIFSGGCDGFNTWSQSNRKIKSITLDSGVEITVKQLEEIAKNIK